MLKIKWKDKLLSHLVHLRKVIEKPRAVNLLQLRISKIYFDRFSSCINSYAVGQRVFLKQPNRQKLQLRYPKEFEVIRKIYDNVYEVRSLGRPSGRETVQRGAVETIFGGVLTVINYKRNADIIYGG